MKHILVTGAGGYIGSTLVPKLLAKGYSVRAIDYFFFGIDKLKPHPNLSIIQEDCRQINETHFIGIDAVIDLVAISNDPSGELFKNVTYELNYQARVNHAKIAKKSGVKRYVLPSSCSVYGFQKDRIVTEAARTNPLTVYAKANEKAERGVLSLASNLFTVTVMRQATVYGYSPRMRFDLAVNGMTYGAWKKGIIPLMRDGTQWRPMVHVEDTTDVICKMLEVDANIINGEVFNVGSNRNNYQLGSLADEIASALPRDVQIKWYGDPDHRSYQVDFTKIEEKLQWNATYTAADGAIEIYELLNNNLLDKTPETMTLDWYKKWHEQDKMMNEIGTYKDVL